jgi:hypothetical protein
MAWLAIFLTLAGVIVTATVLLNHYVNLSVPDPGKVLTRLIDGALGANFSRSQDAILGTGSKVALFEVARSVGPLVALWSLLLAALCFADQRSDKDGGGLALRCDATWVAASAMLVMLLLGLPFAYRAVFVPVILFAALIAHHVGQLEKRAARGAAAALIALTLFIATVEYAVPESSVVAQYYVNRAMPAVLVCLIAVLGTAFAMVLRPAWTRPALALLVILAVLFEKQVIRYHFFHYSFPGQPPPLNEPLSHYSAHDVLLATWIREHYGDGILVSDPYTLAITRALTGLNSAVTFSNLDTMNARAAEELRYYLRGILQMDRSHPAASNCGEWSHAARLLSFGLSSESNYALFQRENPYLSGSEVLGLFGYRSGLLLSAQEARVDAPISENRHAWITEEGFTDAKVSASGRTRRKDREARVITIINRRTVEWALEVFEPRRHDAVDPLETDGNVMRNLSRRCSGVTGPGPSFILAHPLSAK